MRSNVIVVPGVHTRPRSTASAPKPKPKPGPPKNIHKPSLQGSTK